MTPEDKLRTIRKGIGASYRDMADLLGLSSTTGNSRVNELEEGIRPISGPVERILDNLSSCVDLGGGDLANVVLTRYVPEFVRLTLPADQADGSSFNGVMHMRFPRFIGVYTGLLPEPMRKRLAEAGLEQLADAGRHRARRDGRVAH